MADVQPSPDTAAPGPDTAASGPNDGVQTSRLNRPWLVKFVIFMVVLLAFGLWGLYDATVAYPNLGSAHAEQSKWKFLQAAKLAGKLSTTTEVTDPAARYDALAAKLPRSDLEQTEYDWLLALSRLGRLKPEETKIESPNATLDELTKKWNGMPQAKALEAYDLPLQWLIVLVGFGGGAWLILNIVRSASKTYTWEAATNTLTLPGGRRVTPEDLADVDKRKWHKYFCALVFTDGSAPVDLDVLKYSGLEEWVLTMERVRFPERAVAEEEAEAEPVAEGAAEGSADGDEPTNA